MGEGGWWSPAIFEITILRKIFLVWSWILQYTLETSFSSFISKKQGEIPIFRTILRTIFLEWFWILKYMLETSFSSFISKKSGEIPIFRTILAKNWILAYFHWKSPIWETLGNYDVTVTSYMGCLYFFGMYRKKRLIAIHR